MSTATGATAPKVMMAAAPAGVAVVPDVFAKEAMIAWFRGEFAAANAIIDTLCDHIAQVSRGATAAVADYEPVFAAIQRRRANWMPVLHMQKYYSIGEVAFQLRAVAEKRKMAAEVEVEKKKKKKKEEEDVLVVVEEVVVKEEKVVETAPAKVVVQEEVVKREEDSSVESTSLDQISSVDANGGGGGGGGGGSDVIGSTQEERSSVESAQTCSDNNVQICSDHGVCTARPERIKTCKGFSAKEPVKGHMMNVVKGLKMFEDIFVESELSKLAEFISELRAAGRNGELAGETFIFFNKQLKGNKREIIQLGVPIFQSTKEEATSTIEPIPSILQNVIDHLVQWRLIPESRKPNSCFINFFDEGDFSQPYFKPPHLDNPISTLFLYETTMAFGRVLVSDHEGNYKGSLTLPIKEGSLVVMRGNSADMARHVVCPSPNTRVCITFLKVRPPKNTLDSSPTTPPPLTTAMTLWKPESAISQPVGYAPQAMSPTWGMALQSPLVMLAPPRPMVMNPTRKANRNNGTGVFLPWSVGPKKYIKHLPPRIQRRRLHSLALPPPLKVQVEKASQIPCIAV